MSISPDLIKEREKDVAVVELFNAIRQGRSGLRHVPGWVKHIIEGDIWRSRIVTSTGERVEFKTFKELLSAELPNGLNTDFKTLWNLCSDHPDVQALLDEVTQGRQGERTDLQEGNFLDIIQEVKAPDGTSRAAGIRKLRKHAPELLDRVTSGEISVHAALIQSGLRQKTFTVPMDAEAAARSLLRNFSPKEIEALIAHLKTGGDRHEQN